MNGDGVLYVLIGEKHSVQAVVSLWSLRRHWDGPVAIAAGDTPSRELAVRIAQDGRFGNVCTVPFDYKRVIRKGSGSVYATKTRMGELSPFDRTVFLDADTLVAGDFTDLFPEKGTDEVRLTQFCDWTTAGRMISGRVRGWMDVCPDLASRSLRHSYPAINTGVMGFTSRSTPFMKCWQETAMKKVVFICDEIACQLIFLDFPHVVLDHRWNCSPPLTPTYIPGVNDGDVRVWHGHGRKFKKKARGRQVWWPWLVDALELDLAGMREWFPAADKELKKFLVDPSRYSGTQKELDQVLHALKGVAA